MKDALVGFCGCLKMRKVLISRMTPMMQVTTMIQGSFAFRAVNPFVKMTDSPIKHTTGKKEKDRVSDGELAACIGSEYHHLHEAKVQ